MNKKIKFILLMLSCCIFIMACQPISEKLSETLDKKEEDKLQEPSYGGEITLPLTKFSSLNPLTTKNESYFQFTDLIYDSLFEFNKELKLENNLVKAYNILEGGKVVDIKLREDVKWHDGERFSAEDVVFTVEAIKAAGPESIYGDMIRKGVASYGDGNLNTIIEATGGGTEVRIIFDRPTSNNLEVLTFPIVPKHIFGTVKNALTFDNYNVIGTGPFKFKSHIKMKEIILEANEDYREGRPYLDRIKGKILEDEESLIRAFETGQVNMVSGIGADWEKFGKNSRVNALEYPSGEVEFLGFNFRREIFQGEEGKLLRQAIANAIDRDGIIERIYLGHGEKNEIPINPNSWLNSKKIKSYGYNKQEAVEKIKKAGYRKKDSQGYFVKDNGERLSLTLLTNTYNQERLFTGVRIKEDLKEVGIEIILMPGEEYRENIKEEEKQAQWDSIRGNIRRGEFDIILSGWKLSPITDLGFMFHSGYLREDLNFIGYNDEVTDSLITNASLAGQSKDKKLEAYEKLGENLADNLPYITLLFKNKALFLDKSVGGDLDPNISRSYRGMEKVFLNTFKSMK